MALCRVPKGSPGMGAPGEAGSSLPRHSLYGPGGHKTPDPSDAIGVDCQRIERRLTQEFSELLAGIRTYVRAVEDTKKNIKELATEIIVAPIGDEEAAIGLEEAAELSQSDFRVVQVVKDATGHDPVKAGVEKGQLFGP